jgi:hydroxyacylglutathione hydrolase
MFFRQILHKDLGCASYLIADGGVAAVVDPKWEIDDYVRAASEADAEIRYVLETHTHADHVSGRRRLVAATGAQVLVPADPTDPDSPGLHDHDIVKLGAVEVQVIAAPGHRPEHLAFLIVDTAAGRPEHLLSGDSLLIGDVARPDLAVAADDGARALFATLRRFRELPDGTGLWPAHVGGSLCASSAASDQTSSSLGEQRLVNPLLAIDEADAFVGEITRRPPARPPQVERVVAMNVEGAEPPAPLPVLGAAQLAARIAEGATVFDARTPDQYDAGHVEGSMNLFANTPGIGNRAGWAADATTPIVVVGDSAEAATATAELLYAAGTWNLVGVAAVEIDAWRAAGLQVATSSAIGAQELAPRLVAGEMLLIDVRDPGEWDTGHYADALNVPLSVLGDGAELTLPRGRPFAVTCARGGRAALAASILRRRGYDPVIRVIGGVGDLAEAGLPLVVSGETPPQVHRAARA